MSEKEPDEVTTEEIKAIALEGENSAQKKVGNIAKQVVVADDFTKIRRLAEKGQPNLDELKDWAKELKKAVDEFPSNETVDVKDALVQLGEVEEKIREAINGLLNGKK